MANAHRTNVLVTSCLKTPVDPHTKAPLASYERERALPYTATGLMDNRHYEKELEYEDSGSDFCEEDSVGKGVPVQVADYGAAGDRLDLSDIFFSNEEYYSKLEELKRAHLRTMAELESMYRQKLQLQATEPVTMETQRFLWSKSSPAASRRLKKCHSAAELRRSSAQTDSSEEGEAAGYDVEKGLLFSPKEHIKNMWRDFKVSPHTQLSSSLHDLSADPGKPQKKRAGGKRPWRHRVTVPEPFHMTLRETERRKRGVKTRSEVEHENAELRRQLEELTECQRKFHASPVPAHVRLPLYEELQGRRRKPENANQRAAQKPFSFLERERLKKEQKERLHRQPEEEAKKPFRAKPVPRAVYTAAAGEQQKEEQLYRSIKIQMRAKEMLQSAAMPPSMLARRLSERKNSKNSSTEDDFSHRPRINKDVPDFDASYRRFRKQLEKQKEVKPTTTCAPFELRTSQIPSHRQRILDDIEKEQSSPRTLRWPHIGPGKTRTPNSSACSSLSGSMELLPTKGTDATKKRHEAVRGPKNSLTPETKTVSLSRKVLEQRRRAEEEEEQWKERQKERERKLQRVVVRRAQANDPHLALSQTHHNKLKEFREQELQRRREYQQEVREMQQRVKGRPLLLEQVAQRNAKHAAEKRYAEALHGCDLTEDFISSKAAKSRSARKASPSSDSRQSDQEDSDCGFEPLRYRKIFLNDEEEDEERRRDDGRRDDGRRDDGRRTTDESCHYSDDHEEYSEEGGEEEEEEERGGGGGEEDRKQEEDGE